MVLEQAGYQATVGPSGQATEACPQLSPKIAPMWPEHIQWDCWGSVTQVLGSDSALSDGNYENRTFPLWVIK